MKPALTWLALAALCLAQAATAQRVTRTELPGTPGVDLIPTALNGRGQVVGQLSDVVGDNSQAFVWSEAAGLQGLGTLGGSFAKAIGINDSGQIVGESSRFGPSGVTGFFVQPGAAMRRLPGLDSVAGINAAGQVAGAGAAGDVFVYASGLLTPVPNIRSARVTGIADTGWLVGTRGAPLFYEPGAPAPAFVFAGFPTPDERQPPSISPNGRHIVGAFAWDGVSDAHAYLWRWGVLQDLTPLAPAGQRSFASAVNDAAMVAGRMGSAASSHATLWLDGRAVDLHMLAGLDGANSTAVAVNASAQVLLSHSVDGLNAASVLTLHPDWQGGDGDWATSARWSYGGLGPIALAPGAVHDVVIGPAASATVRGAALAEVRSLWVGGLVGEVVTLDLNGGTTRTGAGTQLAGQSVLTGSGRLAGPLGVDSGARIEVNAGQRMQLSGGNIDQAGSVRVAGTGAALEVAGGLFNRAGAEIRVTQASATFAGAVANDGRILASAAELNFAGGLANVGQLGVSFGASGLAGAIDNTGLIVVSNGAQASFAGDIANAGELRVSAGGAANFFGVVSGAGRITGSGQVRFEGGLSASGGVTVEPSALLGAAAVTTLALDGANELDFSRPVRLEGGTLRLSWAAAASAHAGQLWDLFDWHGGVSGRFDSLQLPALAPGLRWDTSAIYASGEIGISAVPEPASWGLLAAGLLAIALRRRRSLMARLG